MDGNWYLTCVETYSRLKYSNKTQIVMFMIHCSFITRSLPPPGPQLFIYLWKTNPDGNNGSTLNVYIMWTVKYQCSNCRAEALSDQQGGKYRDWLLNCELTIEFQRVKKCFVLYFQHTSVSLLSYGHRTPLLRRGKVVKEERVVRMRNKKEKKKENPYLLKWQKEKKLFTHPSFLITPLKHSTNETHCWEKRNVQGNKK